MSAVRTIPSTSTAPDRVSAEEVILLLERAGAIMLRMRVRRLKPAGHRSMWPDVVVDPNEAYGWAAEEPRWAVPTAGEIALMDAVATWPLHVEDVSKRRIVQSRSLVHPVTGRHLYSWRRLAQVLQVHHETVRAWHGQAIDRIVTVVNQAARAPSVPAQAMEYAKNALHTKNR